jgi:prepilin-type N-terminal cleavage/methylation domain-containing protein
MIKNQRGIGLIEVLIAMILFGVGITMALRVLPQSNVATSRGRNISKATNMAQEKIEELMNIPYSDADLVGGFHNDPGNPIVPHFRRTWSVSDDTPVQGMKHIAVTVAFDTASKDSSVTLETFITSRR